MNGFINVLKPPGMSSHDVVNFIRRTFSIKKAGHTGTLDPGAAGVLVICLGTATRLARFLLNDDKEYRAEISFGLSTASGDSFGEVVGKGDASRLTEGEIKSALAHFTGEISQIPPMTSALKYKGKKLYELDRAGLTVERQPRTVSIYSLEYIRGEGLGGHQPKALIHLACSKGTYVRSLCSDIGDILGCGAHMSFLVRTRAGSFKIEDAHTLEDLLSSAGSAEFNDLIIPIDNALGFMPAVHVKSGAARSVASGSKLYAPGVARLPEKLTEGSLVRLIGPEGLLSVAQVSFDQEDGERHVFKQVCVLPRDIG